MRQFSHWSRSVLANRANSSTSFRSSSSESLSEVEFATTQQSHLPAPMTTLMRTNSNKEISPIFPANLGWRTSSYGTAGRSNCCTHLLYSRETPECTVRAPPNGHASGTAHRDHLRICVALSHPPAIQMTTVAVVRKGSRRIVVDGRAYRWQLRSRPSYGQALCETPCTYAVEDYDRPGRTLVVTTNQPHSSNWLDRPAEPILPREVARTIRLAVERGWDPSSSGAPYSLDQSDGFTALR